MPEIEIHAQQESERQKEEDEIMREVVDRLKKLSFAKSCKVSIINTVSINLRDDGKRSLFIRVYSIHQERLDEIGKALKDLPCEIQFVKSSGYKPADSTEIKKPPPDPRTIQFS